MDKDKTQAAAKPMKDIVVCCLVLALVGAFSGGLIGFTRSVTQPIIDASEKEKSAAAAQKALPEATRIDMGVTVIDNQNVPYYIGYFDDAIVGYAIETVRGGYSPDINVITGFGTDGAVSSVLVTSHSETSGIGTLVFESDEFMNQFVGKTAIDSIKLGTDIDALSGATRTSTGVTNAVRAAAGYLEAVVAHSATE